MACLPSITASACLKAPSQPFATGNTDVQSLQRLHGILLAAPLLLFSGAYPPLAMPPSPPFTSFYDIASFASTTGSTWLSYHHTSICSDGVRGQNKETYGWVLTVRHWEAPWWTKGLKDHRCNIFSDAGVSELYLDGYEGAARTQATLRSFSRNLPTVWRDCGTR